MLSTDWLVDWLPDSTILEFSQRLVVSFFCLDTVSRELYVFDLQLLSSFGLSNPVNIASVADGVDVFDSSCAGLTDL